MNIGAIPRLATRCAICSQKEYCERKEMENCAYFIPETLISEAMTVEITQPLMQPLLRDPVKEQREREINKQFNICNMMFGA